MPAFLRTVVCAGGVAVSSATVAPSEVPGIVVQFDGDVHHADADEYNHNCSQELADFIDRSVSGWCVCARALVVWTNSIMVVGRTGTGTLDFSRVTHT